MRKFGISLIVAFLASSVQATPDSYILGLNYGVVVSQASNSCSPSRMRLDVDTPYILLNIESSKAWGTVLTPAIRRLNDRCGAKMDRPLATSLVVNHGAVELARAKIDYDGARWGKGGRSELELSDLTYNLDPSEFERTTVPAERFWEGTLRLTPEVEAAMIDRDTGEDYYALAYKVTQASVDVYVTSVLGLEPGATMDDILRDFGVQTVEELAASGVVFPEIGTTTFGPIESFEPLRGANLTYLTAAADLGYTPALRALAAPLKQKMQTLDRSTRRLTYRPDRLSAEERDQLLLYVAKIYVVNPIAGSQDGSLLTALGLDVQRAVDVVERLGLTANVEDLRAAPDSDRAPTRFQMAKAFGKTLISEKCDALTAFAKTGAPGSLLMRADGNACVWSAGLGYSLRLSVDRVFSPDCSGGDGRYTCIFTYNLYCDVAGQSTGGAFRVTYCLPFTVARQPARAVFIRNGVVWRAEEFEFLE